jgi:tetratricopeptide (TPR) repeat protein
MKKTNKQFELAQQWMRSGNLSQAVKILSKLIDDSPDAVPYLLLRGEAYLRFERYELAVVDLAKVVHQDNKNIRGLNNFGVALIRTHKYNDAKDIYEYLLELQPDNFDAYINLGNIHQALFQSQDALNVAMKAIALRPTAGIAYNNLGSALGDLNHIQEAKEAYITANALDPSYVPAYINLAQLQEKSGNRSEARDLYEKVLLLKNISPGEAELVKYYLGYSYLFFGELSKGWIHYDYGFGPLLPVGAIRSLRKFNQPRWRGEQSGDKRLLIWREQGLGDEIDFSTCLPDVAKLGMNVILECETRLIPAFKRLFPNWEVRQELVDSNQYSLLNDFDFQCPVGSLPGIFRKEISLFNNKNNILIPLDSLKNKFTELLKPYQYKVLVGISWRGGKLSVLRNDNYTGLIDWKEILQLQHCTFVNLQYGECEEELLEVEKHLGIQILRWPELDLKNDLESVMALTSCLNYVVSVGTAISSIAPALGIPTILLTLRNWLLLGQENNYPWYSCVKPLIAERNQSVASQLKNVPQLLK